MHVATQADVRRLVDDRVREPAGLDFKTALPPSEKNADLARDMAAMANAGGGTIVVGISDRGGRAGKLHPFLLAGAAERVASIARDRIDEPMVVADLVDVPMSDGGEGVLVIHVEPGERVPYLVDGQAWGRSGPRNITLRRAEVGRLFATGGEAFLREHGVSVRRPASIQASVGAERRPTGTTTKGKIRYSTYNQLVLENVGGETAHDVDFEFATDPATEQPVDVWCENKPIKQILPGQKFSCPMLVAGGTSRTQEIKLSWKDENGQPSSVEQSLSV